MAFDSNKFTVPDREQSRHGIMQDGTEPLAAARGFGLAIAGGGLGLVIAVSTGMAGGGLLGGILAYVVATPVCVLGLGILSLRRRASLVPARVARRDHAAR
ncbi:hypothetical protein KM176_13925 [Pseudooceanicola sp. CBS1P-1]|uniref:Uncharacterized protein n=1 Tax=Pseudooceanicola albus TaxID=2692189 RepID=A0A6L7G204_9RHOB|nr:MULTISPECIES: hypothetical protein [Pseudooceanicola]MBT9384964.1 hypothetical protein [Pseudooceanicola endophyticus]MXN18041.1 hypothetical protein [Pseudooceanicola albus]